MPNNNDILFKVNKLDHIDGVINAQLGINKDCEIFKGHFPGNPVVPGACMLQIVKEVLEEALNGSLLLKKADHLKFIQMIDPVNTSAVNLNITYKVVEGNGFNAVAKLTKDEVVYFKFQGGFVKIAED
jgi:3-hydroxyacyl-[acyl-carrier-protein] dehydratase